MLAPQFAAPLPALWASNLRGGHIANHLAFVTHFKNSRYYLLQFNAAWLYPWVVDTILAYPQHFTYIPLGVRQNRVMLLTHLQEQGQNTGLQEKVLTEAITLQANDVAGRIHPLYCRASSTAFLAQEGVPFLRDVQWRDKEGNCWFLSDKRSMLSTVKPTGSFRVCNSDITLANGTFWVGSNYTLIGVSEFVPANGLSAPDRDAMNKTEASFKRLFNNHLNYPIIWVEPEKPVHYRGHDYYYPLTGHLDDFMCPLYASDDREVYLYAELDSAFYCGNRTADSDTIVNLQRPLLQETATHVMQQLTKRGKKLELIFLPVLWDEAGFYSCINCITEETEEGVLLHMPRYRLHGNKKFNQYSVACEKEINRRLNRIGNNLKCVFIPSFNFTEQVRANKGSIHCLVNPYPA